MGESDKKLSNALVRICHQSGGDDGFAGCAVRLNSQFVVTCAHVLETAVEENVPLQEGMMFSSFFEHHLLGDRDKNLKLLRFFPEKTGAVVGAADIEDLALLEIQGGEECKQLGVLCPEEYKETGENFVVKSSINADASDAECMGVFFAGWLNLKFDNGEQIVDRGDSGSPVWNETRQAITAMLVARKKKKGTCYAIPMYKVEQAFADLLAVKPITSNLFKQEDDKYLDEIKEDVLRDLDKSNLFRSMISKRCSLKVISTKDILNYLISQCESGSFAELARSLRSAFADGIEGLDKKGGQTHKDLYDASSGVVSKLVVFTIQQKEILRLKQEFNDGTNVASPLAKLVSPVAAGMAARTLGSPMNYMRKKCGSLEGETYVSLESGFRVSEQEGSINIVDTLLIRIAGKVIPLTKVDVSKKTWRKDLVRQLNATIEIHKDDPDIRFRRLFFFILPLNEDDLSEKYQDVMRRLNEYVPDVRFFYITSKYAHDVLTVDDVKIEAGLRAFFTTLDGNKPNEQ